MKRFLKPLLISVGGALILALIVTSVIFFIPRDNTSFSFECYRLRLAVSGFLKDLEKQRYDEAFDRIYPISEDGTPLECSERLKEIWVERVSELETSTNTYLKDFSNLKVVKRNGEFIVTVTLSVIREGYNDPFYAGGSELSVIYDDGWKISSVTKEKEELQTPFEKALSGRFVSEELNKEAD